ncbi:hypothetical protein [Xanthobacter sediminis]
MSTVIAFPSAREAARAADRARRTELPGPKIVILPVVRIERHADAPEAHPRSAADNREGVLLHLDFARTPCGGAGPAGRRH